MKLDPQKDAGKIRSFIKKRIRNYSKYENLGPGNVAERKSLGRLRKKERNFRRRARVCQSRMIRAGFPEISPTEAFLMPLEK